VIVLKDLPLIWKSQLQVGIATSTAEAEVNALHAGLRSLVALRTIFFEICDCFDLPVERVSTISHAYEDNEACRLYATADPPRLTARNKHWNIRHHWFRSQLGDNTILVQPIASADQKADIFTKALKAPQFIANRKSLLGW